MLALLLFLNGIVKIEHLQVENNRTLLLCRGCVEHSVILHSDPKDGREKKRERFLESAAVHTKI